MEKWTIGRIKDAVVGNDKRVPVISGEERRYINFDNAASTPTLIPVMETIRSFMDWYSSIHRGTGFKSQLSTHFYEQSRETVRKFFNIRDEEHTIIFGKNATEAINKLARRMPVEEDSVILVSKMEHHSNDLPWRMRARVVHINVDSLGKLDLSDLKEKLDYYGKRVRLVALTGASNVTGYINPIHEIAEMVHACGAEIMVDAAQLAPHRAIDMKPQDDPRHIDYLTFSAHKIYAPFGMGVLIANRESFEKGDPDYVGGGTVSMVSVDHVFWADVPEKEEAGTPNVVGAIALAKALQVVQEIGMDAIAEHEARLTAYALKHLKKIPGIALYGSVKEEEAPDRLGVISFNMENKPHALVAAMLNYESGIGMRNGCFCAHPYLKCLLGVNEAESMELEDRILHHDRSTIPGAVRMSFGMYNTEEEVNTVIEALGRISRDEYEGTYILDKEAGEYRPENVRFEFEKYFQI